MAGLGQALAAGSGESIASRLQKICDVTRYYFQEGEEAVRARHC